MIVAKTEEHAEIIKKAFEHVGLMPVIVIATDLWFVCKSYEESMWVMALL